MNLIIHHENYVLSGDTVYLKKEGHLMIDEIALDLMNSFQA